jgi:N-acetylmuramoyl-L-alanine amidase
MAMLDRLAPGWDVSPDLDVYAETWAHAVGVAIVWAINTRVRRCFIPSDMQESLPTWETACRLRPEPTDTVHARRRAVAARLRGLAGNALLDIEATARSALGSHFVELRTVAEVDAITHWPGINPGPPGFEWFSNRAHIAVVIDAGPAGDADLGAAVARTLGELDLLTPAWMTFLVGTADDCIADLAISGLTLV